MDIKADLLKAAEKASPLIAIRRGEISPDGAYFSTEGMSTYFDEGAVELGEAQKYDLSDLRIADTEESAVTLAILQEVAKDPSLTREEQERVQSLIAEARKGEPFIDYFANDELPLPAAAKRLGYDGIRVWENDDVGGPTSLFVWAVGKIKKIS
jgi:hypothetical protein